MKLNIRTKLFAAFGALLVLLAVVGFAGWRSVTTLSAEFETLYHDNLLAAVYLANAQDALWQLRYGFPQFIVLGADERAQIFADEPKWYQQIDENLKAYAAGSRTPDELTALKEWEGVYTQYIQARPRWFELYGQGKIEEAAAWRAQTTTPYGRGSVAALGQLIELQRQVAAEKELEVSTTVVTSMWILIGTIGLALVVGLGVAFFLSWNIANPLVRITDVARAVSAGNLDVKAQVNSRDETGVLANAFNQVVAYQQQMAQVADRLAQGDVTVSVTPQSDRDVLSNAFRQMIAYQQQMAQVADRLTQGDVTVNITPKSDQDALGQAFTRMIAYQQQMAGAAGRLAQGDLTTNITPQSDKDVLGNAFSLMIANLRNLVSQVADTADTVGTASDQLATAASQAGQASQQVTSTIQQIAQGTTQQTQSVSEATNNTEQTARAAEGIAKGAQEQAQGVQKTSSLVGEMANIVDQVGQVTHSVGEANAKVTQAARHGVSAVGQTSQGMDTIRVRAITAADKVKEMSNRSKEIGRIVETIDDIADKTNMLALNAAVEAARAGEHGRGFAVVADQVRKLSEDSKGATRDIAELIERVQETVSEAIGAMESTVTEVDNGTRLAGDTARSLEEILLAAEGAATLATQIGGAVSQLRQKSEGVVEAIGAVSAIVEENTAVAEEMAAGSQQVMQAMEGVASVAEENSASAEEVSASAEEMSAQVEEVVASAQELSSLAEQLRAAIAQFQLDEAGSTHYEQPGRSWEATRGSASRQRPKAVATPVDRQGNGVTNLNFK